MKGVLSIIAAYFLIIQPNAFAQSLPRPIEQNRPESFPVRTIVAPGQPPITLSGTITPSIASRISPAIVPGVCGRPGLVEVSTAIRRLRPVPSYDGSGSGPIPDVTDWEPRNRVGADSQVVVSGRNLVPTQLVAMIGTVKLTPMAGSTTTRILYKVDSAAQVGPLVVYNAGGSVRTLDPTYRVFDPTVLVTSVVPTSFQQGDAVTLCGQSLFQAALGWSFSSQHVSGVPQFSSLSLMEGKFVKIGDKFLRVSNAAVSADGSTMTFNAGDLFEADIACINDCNTSSDARWFLNPISPLPTSETGVLTLNAVGIAVVVTGPTLTWHVGGPKIAKAYGVIFQGPFSSLPSENSPWGGMAYVEGTNLNGQWKIGPTAVSSFDTRGDGNLLLLSIPDTASSGQICGTANAVTACTTNSFTVFGGPTIATLPASPLSIGTTYTIEGINLLPPPEAEGFQYRFDIPGLAANDLFAASCNRVLKVLDHTAYHIVFRIGDPAIPVPSGCNQGSLFDPNDTANVMYLWGMYKGHTQGMWLPQRYYLAK